MESGAAAATALAPSLPTPIQTQVCSSPAGPSGHQRHLAVAAGEYTFYLPINFKIMVTSFHYLLNVVTGGMSEMGQSRSGWLDGIFGCFRPVFWNMASKTNKGTCPVLIATFFFFF